MNIEQLRRELGFPEIPTNANHYALKKMEQNPEKLALKYPVISEAGELSYIELTFGEFKKRALKIAKGLEDQSLREGDRIVLLFPVSVELYLTIFACFYIGVIPVFIDATMGPKKLIHAIKESNAKTIISIDKLLKFKLLIPAMWGKKCFSIDKKRFLIKPFKELISVNELKSSEKVLENTSPALITFTSGSTGKPKGANRTIEILLNQKIVSEYFWPHIENEVDMPAFPMITLQNLGCGVTSILPAINFQNFLDMDPALVVDQMECEGVTRFSAQPFFIEKVSDYLIDNKKELPQIRSIVIGGAVVSKPLCRKVVKAFPNAEANIVYGSTEAEPISHTPIQDFISSKRRGLLVGKVVDVLKVKITSSKANSTLEDEVPEGEIGEILLCGPHVIKEYIDNHPANDELKLKAKDGEVWHRTGDLGYLDEEGNLWLVGRIKDQITSEDGIIPCYDLEEELIEFNGVKKAAFIDQGRKLFLEVDSNFSKVDIEEFLVSKSLNHFKIYTLDKLPVDGRHFSRVDRSALRLID